MFDNNNAHEFNQAQQRSVLDARFKFDREGRYAIAFRASTGKYFNWAYADFMGGGNKQAYLLEEQKALPAQTANIGLANQFDGRNVVKSYPSGGWAFNLRELYADVTPVKGIEVQYESVDIDRGVAREITTYDYNGYISGERLQLKRPQTCLRRGIGHLRLPWRYLHAELLRTRTAAGPCQLSPVPVAEAPLQEG